MNPVLLAPAGNFESLSAALNNGADAVYFGVGNLNMRSRATVNFKEEDLPLIASLCHERGVRAWLTLNTVIFDEELEAVRTLCRSALAAGIDAVIAADAAVLTIARETGLSIHLSVQANITNLEAVRFYSRFADVMVLARELNLAKIEAICRGVREQNIRGPSGELVQIEVFVHGALCVAVSGKCYMSLAVFNSSANRGDCYQPCRRAYNVRDAVNGQELEIDNHYVMSPNDLCTIDILPRILNAGVSVLKIEGRGRAADYVATVTKVYREAVDLWKNGSAPSEDQMEQWKKRLYEVFHRGFWHGGYYLGEKTGEWTASSENKSTIRKEYLGQVVHYYPKAKVAEIRLTAGTLGTGERFLVMGPTTGAVEGVVSSLRVNDVPAEQGGKGDFVTFPFDTVVRKNDAFYKLVEREDSTD